MWAAVTEVSLSWVELCFTVFGPLWGGAVWILVPFIVLVVICYFVTTYFDKARGL